LNGYESSNKYDLTFWYAWLQPSCYNMYFPTGFPGNIMTLLLFWETRTIYVRLMKYPPHRSQSVCAYIREFPTARK